MSERSIRQHIPNALTIVRVFLAVAFFAILSAWSYAESPLAMGNGPDLWLLAAAAVFLIAAVTDAADGYLARKWKVVSVFGRVMDPFADKVLVIGGFVFLAGPAFTRFTLESIHAPEGVTLVSAEPAVSSIQLTAVYPWMVALILGRELLITSVRAAMEQAGVAFPATASGKWKMILQSVCVPGVLVLLNFRPEQGSGGGEPFDWPGIAIQVLVWATVIVTAWSGVPYITRAVRATRRHPESTATP